MPYNAQVYRIFIASPSDVAEEREAVRGVIADWNAAQSAHRGIVLLPVGWETHAVPQMGVRPQEHINETVLKDCDILIGVFWSRMGMDAGSGMTGTEEEIQKHLLSGKKAHLYFSTRQLPHDIDTEQLGRMRAFKEEIQKTRSGLYGEFVSVAEFRGRFRHHLEVLSQGLIASQEQTAANDGERHLTFNAEFILKKMASSKESLIHVKDSLILIPDGPWWKTTGNGKLDAELRDAIKLLADDKLIWDIDGHGERFRVTTKGFDVAGTIPDDIGTTQQEDQSPAS